MDPNVILAEMLSLSKDILGDYDNGCMPNANQVADLAERVQSLDGWIRNGGFLPSAWNNR